MKRFFKFATLLLAAVVVCSLVEAKAPKAKQLIGEWQVDTAMVNRMLGIEGALPDDLEELDVDALLTLKRGDKANFVADVSMMMEVEEGVYMSISFDVTFHCMWSYYEELLKVDVESYDFKFKDITLDPVDPEFEQMLPHLIPIMEQAMREEMAESLSSVEVVRDATVELVSKDELKVTERHNGESMTLVRK